MALLLHLPVWQCITTCSTNSVWCFHGFEEWLGRPILYSIPRGHLGTKCPKDVQRTCTHHRLALPAGRKAHSSVGRCYCENDPNRLMIADILLMRNDERWVLDAKYKRDFGNESRNDRFQMCAYAIAFTLFGHSSLSNREYMGAVRRGCFSNSTLATN